MFCFKINIRYKINIWKRCKVKHSIEKKLPKTFLENNEEIIINKKAEDNLTLFEPKHPISVCYETDAIPLSQRTTFDIKCLKWDLKDSPVCLNLAYFHPKIKQKNNLFGISGSSLYFFSWCCKFFLEKRIHNTYQFLETRPRDNEILQKQSKICRLSYEMDRIALFRIIFWRNKIHFGKILPILRIQEYYWTNSIRKCV